MEMGGNAVDDYGTSGLRIICHNPCYVEVDPDEIDYTSPDVPEVSPPIPILQTSMKTLLQRKIIVELTLPSLFMKVKQETGKKPKRKQKVTTLLDLVLNNTTTLEITMMISELLV